MQESDHSPSVRETKSGEMKHDCLDAGEIRLLELKQTYEGTRLQGKIVHAKLEEAPKYTALSYVWGDSRESVSLPMESGQAAQITTSLQSGLFAILKTAPVGSLCVWADQICINQNDDREKSHQVAMMAEIYEGAKKTVVWLGEDINNYAASTFAWISRVFSTREKLIEARSVFATQEDIYSEAIKFDEEAERVMTQEAFEGLVSLIQVTWFGRIWVAQEAIRSRNTILVWGQEQLAWNKFAVILRVIDSGKIGRNLMRALRQYIMEGVSYREERKKLTAIQNRLTFFLMLDRDFRKHETDLKAGHANPGRMHTSTELSCCLESSIFLGCKVDYDRILAIVGLCYDATSIERNYQQTIFKLFRDVAVHIITNKRAWTCSCPGNQCKFEGISLFSRLGELKQQQGIPTWVPTWQRDTETGTNSYFNDIFQELGYDASQGTVPSIRLCPNPNHIQVHAKVWDRVVAAGLDMGYTDQVEHMVSNKLRDEWKKQSRLSLSDILRIAASSVTFTEAATLALQCHAYGATDQRIGALWRTLCADAENFLAIKFYRIPSYERDEYQRLFESQESFSERILDALRSEDPLQVEQTYEYVLAGGDLKDTWLSKTAYYNVSTGRKFFVTEQGFMGIGHPRLKSNDRISIFLGSHVPMLIREQNDGCYNFVGDCFVLGIMDGEIMDMSEYPIQRIVIS